jgi:hypothetical protein
VALAVAKTDSYDFLIDIVPREDVVKPKKAVSTRGGSALHYLTFEKLRVIVSIILNRFSFELR